MYQDFGDLYLDFSATGITDASASNYVRDLDMSTAVSTVNFDHGGVHYQREYFVSYPDQVAVVRLSASGPGKLTFTTSTTAASGLTTTATADPNEKRITLAYQVSDNQMRAEMQLKLQNEGGAVSSSDGRTLTVTAADTVTLVYSTGTNYKNDYPTYRGEDPHGKLTQRVDSAIASGYGVLLDRHLADYQELFSRVQFDVGATVPDIPTDQLMRNYRAGSYDLAVDQMAYQFGRYLSISRLADRRPSHQPLRPVDDRQRERLLGSGLPLQRQRPDELLVSDDHPPRRDPGAVQRVRRVAGGSGSTDG